MNMIEAVTACLRKYATFSGRAIRSEYWYWTLANAIVCTTVAIIDESLNPGEQLGLFSAVAFIVTFGTMLPGLAVSVRRLHDVDKSGWWLMLSFTVVGIIPLIYWACQPGTVGENRFGSDPMPSVEAGKLRLRQVAA